MYAIRNIDIVYQNYSKSKVEEYEFALNSGFLIINNKKLTLT